MNIGEKIRNAREDMDLSQRDMANLIPMNQSNYSKIERNVQEPNISQLRRICELLRIDPAYLLDIHTPTDRAPRLLVELRALLDRYERER